MASISSIGVGSGLDVKSIVSQLVELEKRPLQIAFPTPFIAILRLLANLPKRLQVALGKRLARTSDGKPS